MTPTSLRDLETQKTFNNLVADVAIVAAYGLILPTPILEAPKHGCLNLHASLLPRWRGAAPIHRAIIAGDSQTGVDVMRMVAGLDAGPIAMREIVPISPDDTAGDLTSRLAAIGAKLSVMALQSMEAGLLEFHDQPTAGACYAHKIEKIEADIDWTQRAETVRNQIHGLSPTPGAFSKIRIGRGATLAPGVVFTCPVGLHSRPEQEFEFLFAIFCGSQDLACAKEVKNCEMLHFWPH
jgi:methionyl-tRNA formyltransferase